MVTPENTNWLYDYELIDDIPIMNVNFSAMNPVFCLQALSSNNSSSYHSSSIRIDASSGESGAVKEDFPKKRARFDSCGGSSSKACREKLRRDRLNDKFVELGSIFDPQRPPKTDKVAILADAIRMVSQLRGETQKLKDMNINLEEKIKELKTEKNELREENHRLKAKKDKLEQQMQLMNPQPSFLLGPPAVPSAFTTQGHPGGTSKLVPFINYPGMAMWQFMPPAALDTSQDHVLRPPVA